MGTQLEALDCFTADIERLVSEQRALNKTSTAAKTAATKADNTVAKLRKMIADQEERKQVRCTVAGDAQEHVLAPSTMQR